MVAGQSPDVLISAAHCKLVGFGRVDKDGVQPHFLIALLHNHEFTGTKKESKNHAWVSIGTFLQGEDRPQSAIVCYCVHKTPLDLDPS